MDVEVLSEKLAEDLRKDFEEVGASLEDLRILAGIDKLPRMPKMPRMPSMPAMPRISKMPDMKIAHRFDASVYTGFSAIMDTAVKPKSADPYRSPGKQTLEEILKESGIQHEFLVSVPEGLTEEQRELVDRIDKVHPNLKFIHVDQIKVAMVPAQRPNILVRMWRAIWS